MKKYLRMLLALALVAALLCPAALAEAAEIGIEEGLLEGPVEETTFELEDSDELPAVEDIAVVEDIPADEVAPEDEAAPADAVEIDDESDFASSEAVQADGANEDLDDFELDVHELELGVGEKFDLYPSVGGAIPEYESDDPKIAKVDKNGTVRAVKVGTCTITAWRDDIVDYCEVTVKKAPKSITANYKTITLGYDKEAELGESFDLEYEIPEDSASNSITISGYSSKIIHIDDNNTVTAVGTGSTRIKIRTFNNKIANIKVDVKAAPQSIELNREDLTLGVDSEFQLKAILPAKTFANEVVYRSSDIDVALVTDEGLIYARSEGEADIEVYTFNDVYAECHVDVVAAPSWVRADPDEITLGVGEIMPISVETDVDEITGGLTLTPKNKKIVSVTDDGAIKGVKKGKTVVEVETYNGHDDTIEVTVLAAPSSIKLDKKTMTMGVGDEGKLVATLSKNSTGSYTWTSSNPDVADVDELGNVFAIGSGTAKITARTYNKRTASCTVTVLPAPEEIELESDDISIPYRKSVALPYKVLDDRGKAYKGIVRVEFEPEGVVVLDNNKLKAVGIGDTLMTIYAGDLEEEVYITVEEPAYYHGDGVQVIAHRGGVGDSGEKENTLDAFEVALETGADGVELDVHSTKDGVQVVYNEDYFKVGSKKYAIKNTKFSVIRDKMPSIPTLDEALEVLEPLDCPLHLEMKASANGKKCVELVEDHDMGDRTIFFGFYDAPLKAVYKAKPDATLGLSLHKGTSPISSSVVKKAEKLNIQILVVNTADLKSQTIVDKIHDNGFEISVWTPDTSKAAEKFIDYGVEYILTNYPHYAVDLR